MKKYVLCFLFVSIFFPCLFLVAAEEEGYKVPFVKIYVTANQYNYDAPWQSPDQQFGFGSGCIIEGNRILTNAHVVANQAFIEVRKAGDPEKYRANVIAVAHDCDLALLSVKDEKFFENSLSLPIGDTPNLQDQVTVFGFPIGGDQLSITSGIVSRIDFSYYAHSQAYLLAVQIDAAINPGNSGGPVVKEGKVVGVAFQGIDQSQSIGYMVPPSLIKRFLKEVELGRYQGISDIGLTIENLENPSLRSFLKVSQNQSGVLVIDVAIDGPAYGIVKPNDVIISIDGIPIANDGTIAFQQNTRINFAYLIQQKLLGESVQVEVIRSGKKYTLPITLNKTINQVRLIPLRAYDVEPCYFVFAGFVFQPLDENFLQKWNRSNPPIEFINYYYNGKKQRPNEEVVVLNRILPDKSNVGYQNVSPMIITEVNGQKIYSMKELMRAIESVKGKTYEIRSKNDYVFVIDKDEVGKATSRILKLYRINADRSDNLKN